jgi:hypothetical protein
VPDASDAWDDARRDATQDVVRRDQHCCPEPGAADAERLADRALDDRVPDASQSERRAQRPLELPDAAEPYKQAADPSEEQSFAVQAAAPLSGSLAAEQRLAPPERKAH